MSPKQGIKHTIECHCVLPQFRNRKDTVYHKFVVFSILDESETVIPKHAACNNCGVIHNVYDICKSEIMPGRELGAVMEIKDVKILLPSAVSLILESYDCDVATWEQTLFMIQERKVGNIILTRDEEEGMISGKFLKIDGPGKYSLEPYQRQGVL